MTEIVLFHHAQGLTPGVQALADELRAAGHTVHVPDSYEGRTFDDLEEGVGHAQATGFETVMQRGVAAAQELPAEVVYVGISLGAMPATLLAQTREGARGLVMLHSAIPPHEFAAAWPEGVPVQIHTSAQDAWGDADVAEEFTAAVPGTELFLYDNGDHLFVDSSLPVHDPASAAQVTERVLAFLERVG
jgi:dienelactone hydrolase